ncbi:unnamed protein product, partial [Discosporangium mesarthrocarpum]
IGVGLGQVCPPPPLAGVPCPREFGAPPPTVESFAVSCKDASILLEGGGEILASLEGRRGVKIDILPQGDPRAPPSAPEHRVIRVTGGQEQVRAALEAMRALASVQPLEAWLEAQKQKLNHQEALNALHVAARELTAVTQASRPRQRWCLGSDWHSFSPQLIALAMRNKRNADLRRNALQVTRKIAEAGKPPSPPVLLLHAVRNA